MSTRTRTYAPTTAEAVARTPGHSLVTVEVTMDHLAEYGRPKTVRLAYGAKFFVHVGQHVLCPPTRLNSKWTRGKVVAINEPGDYAGRVKYVAPLGRRTKK